MLLTLAHSCVVMRPALGQTTFGTLNNFDVFNDTGQECHGFEIELDGVSSTDVSLTFGSPYQRYGNPTVVDFSGGVYIRYESPYDLGSQAFTPRRRADGRCQSRRRGADGNTNTGAHESRHSDADTNAGPLCRRLRAGRCRDHQ